MLAVLLMTPGHSVPVLKLVDCVWGDDPPRVAQPLAPHVSRLRRTLAMRTPGLATLRFAAGGYLIDCDETSVDLHRARLRWHEGRSAAAAGDDETAWELLADAGAGWEPVALAGIPGEWAQRARESLRRERLELLACQAAAGLRLGRYGDVVDDLRPVVDEQPTAEVVVAPLLEALLATGRCNDALACFARTRSDLAEELGAEPSPALQALHARILRRESRATAGGRPTPVATRPSPVHAAPRPSQLPADVRAFTGRATELAMIDGVLAEPGGLCLVTGPAGVGKTALAVRWGHQRRDHFPDGHLYANLRGHDPDDPADPATVLAGLLTGLGDDVSRLPDTLDALAARLRTLTADRRLLLVLDNASSAEQIRPLLPGSERCAVIVTSRDSLQGLVAVNGAERVALDVLPPQDATALLRALVGARVDDEPDAADLLARRCDRLPLALRVAAELVGSRPDRPLAALADELADERDRLSRLDAGGDPRAGITAVFSWSLRHLPPAACRTFVAFGVHPGPDLGTHAAAALSGQDPDEAEQALRVLCDAHLVRSVGQRFAAHDLLRAYAKRLMTSGDAARMLDRLLNHYVAVVGLAMDLAYPAEAHRRPAHAVDPWAPQLRDAADALAWLDDERSCLVAAARAARDDRPGQAVLLSHMLYRYLDAGHPAEAREIHAHARAAAANSADLAGEARALLGLGAASRQQSRHQEARRQLERALVLFRTAGDDAGQARALTSLGVVLQRLGRYPEAAEHHDQARVLFHAAGDLTGEAKALTNLGVVHACVGEKERAVERYQCALEIAASSDDDEGRGYALHLLGDVEGQLGRHQNARMHLTAALALARGRHDATAEGWILDSLGILAVRSASPAAAAEHHEAALAIFETIGDRDGQAWALNGRGEAAFQAGLPAAARDLHVRALALARDTGSRDQEARALLGLARMARAEDDRDAVREALTHVRAIHVELGMSEAHHDDERLLDLPMP